MTPENDPRNWRAWVAPGVMLGVLTLFFGLLTLQLEGIRDRFGVLESRLARAEQQFSDIDAKIDRRGEAIERRVVETNSRIDRVLEQLTAIAGQNSRTEVELGYIRSRLDRVADKLQVTSAPAPAPLVQQFTPVPAGDLKELTRLQQEIALLYDPRTQTLIREFTRSRTPTTSEPTVALAAADKLKVGDFAPDNLKLLPMPDELLARIPGLRPYGYAATPDRIIVARLDDRFVVALIS